MRLYQHRDDVLICTVFKSCSYFKCDSVEERSTYFPSSNSTVEEKVDGRWTREGTWVIRRLSTIEILVGSSLEARGTWRLGGFGTASLGYNRPVYGPCRDLRVDSTEIDIHDVARLRGGRSRDENGGGWREEIYIGARSLPRERGNEILLGTRSCDVCPVIRSA